MPSSSLAGFLCIGLCLCLGNPVSSVSSPTDPADCPDGKLVIPASATAPTAKLTPDYIEGPWMKLDAEHPFKAWTERPRIVKTLQLLGSVADTILESDKIATQTREASLPEETAIIREGSDAIQQLRGDIAKVLEKRQAFESIEPTQQEITDKVNKILAPKLLELSKLQQTSADIRFPFAERLAAFTDDLQKVLRAKVDAQNKLKGFVSKDELKQTLKQYDEMGNTVQAKINAEMEAAAVVLNPNTKAIHDVQSVISQTEREIKDLREQLTHFMDVGGSFINGEAEVKGITLASEQHLVNALKVAGATQDTLLADNSARQTEMLSVIHHIAVLDGALLQGEVPDQPAVDPLKAAQTIVRQ